MENEIQIDGIRVVYDKKQYAIAECNSIKNNLMIDYVKYPRFIMRKILLNRLNYITIRILHGCLAACSINNLPETRTLISEKNLMKLCLRLNINRQYSKKNKKIFSEIIRFVSQSGYIDIIKYSNGPTSKVYYGLFSLNDKPNDTFYKVPFPLIDNIKTKSPFIVKLVMWMCINSTKLNRKDGISYERSVSLSEFQNSFIETKNLISSDFILLLKTKIKKLANINIIRIAEIRKEKLIIGWSFPNDLLNNKLIKSDKVINLLE